MPTLEISLAEEFAETAHWGDEPPVRIEEEDFDLLAFELWHLGSYPIFNETDEWEDEHCTVGNRASCL